ncbi:TrmB family transcriptional regulator [Patescibacteria group bacterium]
MVLAQKLQQIGLTDKEAKVYQSLLELGQATAQSVASKSGVNRATTYVALESLIDKGLVSSILKQKKTFFIIESPLQLLELLYKEQKSTDEKIVVAKKLMPELEMLERLTGERAKVKLFEGKSGIELIQKSIERSKLKVFDTIFHVNEALNYFPISPDDHRQVIERKIKDVRAIFIYDPKLPIPKYPVFKGEERRYLPANKFPFHADFTFWVDRVALISFDNLVGIVIENKTIVEALRTMFNLAWDGAQEYKSIKGLQDKKKS